MTDDLRKAVRDHRRPVVLSDLRSGKTTKLRLLRREYALAAKQDPVAPLPVLVALGGYSTDESEPEYVSRYARNLGRHLPVYLHSGRDLLLLDALNDMPQRAYQERVQRIQTLMDRISNVLMVVTCRASDYSKTLPLRKLEIGPLDVSRQREYLLSQAFRLQFR